MTGIMTYIHHLIIYLIASEMKRKTQTMVVDVGMIIIYICSSLGFQTANKEAYLKHQTSGGIWKTRDIWGFPKMVVPNNHGFSY